MKIVALILFMALASQTYAQNAAELGWLGDAGDTPCSNWNDLRSKKTSKRLVALKSWVLGFISGINNAPKADRILSRFNEADILTRIDSYCRDHKTDLLARATMSSVTDLLQTSTTQVIDQQRSVTVSDNSTGLTGIAAATAKLLTDAAVAPKDDGNGALVVEIKQLHCDQYSVIPRAPSDPAATSPGVTCRVNAENTTNTTTGDLFREGRALMDILVKIQESSASSGIRFMNCAVGGYCSTYIESIKCITNTTPPDAKRSAPWICTFRNGQ